MRIMSTQYEAGQNQNQKKRVNFNSKSQDQLPTFGHQEINLDKEKSIDISCNYNKNDYYLDRNKSTYLGKQLITKTQFNIDINDFKKGFKLVNKRYGDFSKNELNFGAVSDDLMYVFNKQFQEIILTSSKNNGKKNMH